MQQRAFSFPILFSATMAVTSSFLQIFVWKYESEWNEINQFRFLLTELLWVMDQASEMLNPSCCGREWNISVESTLLFSLLNMVTHSYREDSITVSLIWNLYYYTKLSHFRPALRRLSLTDLVEDHSSLLILLREDLSTFPIAVYLRG